MCDGFMLVEARQYKRMRPVIKGWDARPIFTPPRSVLESDYHVHQAIF